MTDLNKLTEAIVAGKLEVTQEVVSSLSRKGRPSGIDQRLPDKRNGRDRTTFRGWKSFRT